MLLVSEAELWHSATGGDRAGVLESSFVAEVKSDLMGEQTILCGEPARPKRRRVQGLVRCRRGLVATNGLRLLRLGRWPRRT